MGFALTPLGFIYLATIAADPPESPAADSSPQKNEVTRLENENYNCVLRDPETQICQRPCNAEGYVVTGKLTDALKALRAGLGTRRIGIALGFDEIDPRCKDDALKLNSVSEVTTAAK